MIGHSTDEVKLPQKVWIQDPQCTEMSYLVKNLALHIVPVHKIVKDHTCTDQTDNMPTNINKDKTIPTK